MIRSLTLHAIGLIIVLAVVGSIYIAHAVFGMGLPW
jgi:hypothetical protein